MVGRAQLEADYLVIGAGAVGMIFVDEILSGSDATVLMVDRREASGGHWNDAYPFVRLHQPAVFYGAGSRALGADRIDDAGPNQGLYELPGRDEVLAYFDGLMRERFLAGGRVTFLPRTEALADGRLISLETGKEIPVAAGRVVDATYFNTTIPLSHARGFEVEDGVRVIPPNRLPDAATAGRYVVLGGGKTGMDACAFLLNRAPPERICWVIPQAAWAVNRALAQPHTVAELQVRQLEAAAQAKSAEHMFELMEAAEVMLRIHPDIQPSVYRGATLAPPEARDLARVAQVVRLGRVRRITRNAIELDRGDVAAAPDDLYIDCTASAVSPGPLRPVFEGRRISIQMVRPSLISLSAAMIGKVATMDIADEARNTLCPPAPLERWVAGFPETFRHGLVVSSRWSREPSLRAWLSAHRLSGAGLPGPEPEAMEGLRRRQLAVRDAAMANLDRLCGPASLS